MIMYIVSGRNRKSSSQSGREIPEGIVARRTVMIATVMSMMSAAEHRLESNAMTSKQPPMNSTEETK